MTWKRESVSGRRRRGMRSVGRDASRWRRIGSKENVNRSCHCLILWDRREMFCIDVIQICFCWAIMCSQTTWPPSDPEVHIGLENLQQFPAFSSSPQNCSPMVQLDVTLAPPPPLSSIPVSGESCNYNVLFLPPQHTVVAFESNYVTHLKSDLALNNTYSHL